MVATEAVWEALSSVRDPEYPLSIVDLGMVYGARVDGTTAMVRMTFTSIGCPAIDMIVSDVSEAVSAIDGIEEVEVEVVWNPPWTKDKISERGRKVLAIYGVAN